jgi:hypothetical protein
MFGCYDKNVQRVISNHAGSESPAEMPRHIASATGRDLLLRVLDGNTLKVQHWNRHLHAPVMFGGGI